MTLKYKIRNFLLYPKDLYYRLKLEIRWQRYKLRAKENKLIKSNVIVSLTSYPPRFPILHLTLKSILAQSVCAQSVILWIAHEDMQKLPQKVTALKKYGLIIRSCDDTKSYKKLIPLLQENNPTTIVTADDDIYYWQNWLKELLDTQKPNCIEVICHRMHRITHSPEGLPLPYSQWERKSTATEPSRSNFPTGVGGILYPPGAFHPDVLDQEAFLALCPDADDIWFFWMANLNNTPIRRTANNHPIYCWRNSQHVSLFMKNVPGGFNDRQIKAMIEKYGYFK